jgi:pimeloyl-ACP methyl ester carboxylesterase
MVHGFPLDGRVYNEQIKGLSAHARVIVPDLPGFGKSKADRDFTIGSLADELQGFLAEVGALPCVLAGLSMGGYVALAFARKYLADLRGLVLIDTRSEADTDEGRANRDRLIASAKQDGIKAVVNAMFPKMIAESTAHARPEVAKKLRDIMDSQPVETVIRALTAMRDRDDATPWLAGIDVPALILVGAHDAITPPAAAEKMHAALPKSWLVTIENSGHMTPMEQPERVTELIGKFVDEIKRTP